MRAIEPASGFRGQDGSRGKVLRFERFEPPASQAFVNA
jgi:hypothetical protein